MICLDLIKKKLVLAGLHQNKPISVVRFDEIYEEVLNHK